jgi:hypothetical protein
LSESTLAVIIIILALLLALALAFWGSRFLMKRAIAAVVKKFREHNALEPFTAMTLEELGLKSTRLLEIRGLRDYKPTALQLLIRNEIIQVTEGDRLFLSEDALSRTSLERKNSR